MDVHKLAQRQRQIEKEHSQLRYRRTQQARLQMFRLEQEHSQIQDCFHRILVSLHPDQCFHA